MVITDFHQMAQRLSATYREIRTGTFEFSFSDRFLKYQLFVGSTDPGMLLRADPEDPSQPCPMLEFPFICRQIIVGPSAYDDSKFGNAVRFYELENSIKSLRLTLSPRENNAWYIWASGVPIQE